MERSRNWTDAPRREYQVGNLASARPSITSRPGDPGRMLLRHNEPRTERARNRQGVLSQRYLTRCIWNPYMLAKYARGGYDYKILAESHGMVSEMGLAYKRDATMYAVLVGMFYVVVIAGLVAGLVLGLASQH